MLFKIKEVSDLMVDACLRNEAGELMFLSIYGRDTGLQQLLSMFTLKPGNGGLDCFNLVETGVERPRSHRVWVGNTERLEKLSGRFPRENLFGNLSHLWIFDPKVRQPDRSNRCAWVLAVADPQDGPLVRPEPIWNMIKHLSSVPLMEHWQRPIEESMWGQIVQDLCESTYPPLGNIGAVRVSLPEEWPEQVSKLVRQGVLHPSEIPAGATNVTLFPLGKTVVTAGVAELVGGEVVSHTYLQACLHRHAIGDWGHVPPSDARENDLSVKEGFRVMSSYPIDPEQPCIGHGNNTIWIITEADRSVTTLLLPDEY